MPHIISAKSVLHVGSGEMERCPLYSTTIPHSSLASLALARQLYRYQRLQGTFWGCVAKIWHLRRVWSIKVSLFLAMLKFSRLWLINLSICSSNARTTVFKNTTSMFELPPCILQVWGEWWIPNETDKGLHGDTFRALEARVEHVEDQKGPVAGSRSTCRDQIKGVRVRARSTWRFCTFSRARNLPKIHPISSVPDVDKVRSLDFSPK